MLLVAEIGLNHEGNFDLAYELLRQASRAGADVAKFQFGWRDGPGEINAIDADRARRLQQWCHYLDLEMMASVISDEGLSVYDQLEPRRYKIASRTVVERPDLVRRVLDRGKETFISLGWWTEEGFPFGEPTEKMRYIFCRSKYPTYPGDLGPFPQRFGDDGYYGYSDHMHGIEGCLLAAGRGARLIEKHFTLDKTIRGVHGDHVLSATFEELRILNDLGRPMARLAATIES